MPFMGTTGQAPRSPSELGPVMSALCHKRTSRYGVPTRAELALAAFFKQSERAAQSICRCLTLFAGHAVDFKLEP
jgi:hypothetical protein